MQMQQSFERPQLPLFDAFLANASGEPLVTDDIAPGEAEQAFSELALRGAAGHCLHLLAPILRELSQNQDARWLTLVAPPASLTQSWLRDAGLNRERILLLARDVPLPRDVFRGNAHPVTNRNIFVLIEDCRAERWLVAAHRHHAHAFGAGRDHYLGFPEAYAVRSQRHCLHARRTETIDRHARYGR